MPVCSEYEDEILAVIFQLFSLYYFLAMRPNITITLLTLVKSYRVAAGLLIVVFNGGAIQEVPESAYLPACLSCRLSQIFILAVCK